MLILVLVAFSPAQGAELKKVRIPFTSYTIEQLPYQLADKKGYFREEGITPEFIYMRSTTITMALASQTAQAQGHLPTRSTPSAVAEPIMT